MPVGESGRSMWAHLQVAHAVGLVDLGAHGGVADGHHLLEHHALLQELPVPLALRDLRIVLQGAHHILQNVGDILLYTDSVLHSGQGIGQQARFQSVWTGALVAHPTQDRIYSQVHTRWPVGHAHLAASP